MFEINPLYLADGYKVGHKQMLAPGTTRLYGTWIPRSLKHAPKGVTKIVSFGQQLVWKYIHDVFEKNFFSKSSLAATEFSKDMSAYLGLEYDGNHFLELHKLDYLPIRVKSLPEGVETLPNIPHMTFVNTVDGFAWLTLYLETIVSSLAWKPSTSATISKQFKKNALAAVKATDEKNLWLADFMCHDFSARGLSPWDMIASGLGHAVNHKGSDTIAVISASRYYYGVGKEEMPVFSVNASEHSVSTTKIFTVGEKQMLIDWLKLFPKGILSVVADTFDLFKLITEYLADPEVKALIMARDGKLVIRPDSGDPVKIVTGWNKQELISEFVEEKGRFFVKGEYTSHKDQFGAEVWGSYVKGKEITSNEQKGVIELLWDIFGGTVNEQGYKVLDSHIGAIYGDSINLDRQVAIYERLKAKGFAATNIVLGVGSYTYQWNTRDTFGFAAKGAWFEILEDGVRTGYDIYKDPATDDGTKKSLKGLQAVFKDKNKEFFVKSQCTELEETAGYLRIIYENGKFFNQTTLQEIREAITF